MTQAELLQLIFIRTEGTAPILIEITTVFFAYVVSVYFVGNKISRFYAVSLSAIYSYFILASLFAQYVVINHIQILYAEYARLYPDDFFIRGATVPGLPMYLVLIGPCLVAWLLSLFFTHAYIRRGGENDQPA